MVKKEDSVQTFKFDQKKFPRIRRNIIITYVVLALVGLGIVYLYLQNYLFSSAWGLIPFVVLVFTLAGWFALRERRRYWDEFKLEVGNDSLTRSAYKTSTVRIKKADVKSVREVRIGLIVSTQTKENALLIPRQLDDNDYKIVKRILEDWAS
jgi:hypothetical protein